MRILTLLALLSAAGCVTLQSPPDRPVPERTLDGVRVADPFSASDVGAILAAVRARTSEPVVVISVPDDAADLYRRHETDALPSDSAVALTDPAPLGRPGPPGQIGSGATVYHLSRRSGEWAVRGSGWYSH